MAIPSENNAEDAKKIIGTWLSNSEQGGWIVKWPEIDGTKTDIVEQLSLLPNWQVTDKKLTKEILSARLGKYNTIKLFTDWMMSS